MVPETDEGTDTASHDPGTRKGENVTSDDGKEAGRHDKGTTGADRPAGGRTSRDSTGINPDDEEPIHPDSTNMPPA